MSPRALAQAALQLPCSVVILSAAADRQQAAMTASAMYVSQVPPLIAVSVSRTFATYQLIEKAKAFAVNVIADSQLDLAQKFGSVHGFEVDKISKFGMSTEPASKIKAPLISGCYANIECIVRSALWDVEGNHAIYIGEVVAFKSDKKSTPMVWLNGRYYQVGTQCKI